MKLSPWLKISSLILIVTCFGAASSAGDRDLVFSHDCIAYKADSIFCDSNGKPIKKNVGKLDAIPTPEPYHIFVSQFRVVNHFNYGKGSYSENSWADIIYTYYKDYEPVESSEFIKKKYVEFLNAIENYKLSLSGINKFFNHSEAIQRCSVFSIVASANWKQFAADFDDRKSLSDKILVQSPLAALHMCRTNNYKILNCGYTAYFTREYKNKNFKETVQICAEKARTKVNFDALFGQSEFSDPTNSASRITKEVAEVPGSVRAAFELIEKSEPKSLEQIKAIQAVFADLTTEWVAVWGSDVGSTSVYSDHNRVIVPIFFYSLTTIQDMELERKTRFKIDLLNNFDLVFPTSPSRSMSSAKKQQVDRERAEVLRLVQGL